MFNLVRFIYASQCVCVCVRVHVFVCVHVQMRLSGVIIEYKRRSDEAIFTLLLERGHPDQIVCRFWNCAHTHHGTMVHRAAVEWAPFDARAQRQTEHRKRVEMFGARAQHEVQQTDTMQCNVAVSWSVPPMLLLLLFNTHTHNVRCSNESVRALQHTHTHTLKRRQQ